MKIFSFVCFYFLIQLHRDIFFIGMLRRPVSQARIVGVRVESRPREATWALADHSYAAAPLLATRRRQALRHRAQRQRGGILQSCRRQLSHLESSSSRHCDVAIWRWGEQQRRLVSHARLRSILYTSRRAFSYVGSGTTAPPSVLLVGG